MTIQGILKRISYAIIYPIKKKFVLGSFALDDIDLKLKKYLLPIKNGRFIEAGAFDGITQSTTYMFEKRYGWTGLLIEPIPELYKKCLENRTSPVLNIALGSEEKDIMINYWDIYSSVESSITKDYTKEALGRNVRPYSTQVHMTTLMKVLTNFGNIDFLSLDVMWYELEVLKGLGTYKPTYILVSMGDRQDIVEYMQSIGYRQVDDLGRKHDILYMHTSL